LDEASVSRLGELADEMEAAPDVNAFLRADREFHLASYTGAASGETWAIIHRMWNATQYYRREFTKLAAGGEFPGGLGVSHLEHRLLLDAVRRQDGDDAERVLVMHIRRTRLELSRHPEVFA
jgi:DNA-binding GntR family transcriptional regulator